MTAPVTKNALAATGRRKTSVARVTIVPGSGKWMINHRPLDNYFSLESLRAFVNQPFHLTEHHGKYDVTVKVTGGGPSGQAGAIRHGLSRALLILDANLRPILRKSGLLTRDPRMKERKKSGQPGARKRFQFSKR